VTGDERRQALEAIADEVRACTRCRLSEGRTRAVPGEGDPDTEVVFVGEGPGFNEDRDGRPFVGRAGGLLVQLLGSIGWRREEVFITNVVKCRPPGNRDPQPDEIAACAPYLRRQLEVLDPAVVVTLGRYSMGTFMPGARIGQAHGTSQPVDPSLGPRDALAFAMYHPAAALRTQAIERESYEDVARVPDVLVRSRDRRAASVGVEAAATVADAPAAATVTDAPAAAEAADAPTTATAGAAASIEATATAGAAAPVDAVRPVGMATAADVPAHADLDPTVVTPAPAGPVPAPTPASDPDAVDASQLTLF
jgi:uracil-DNA glycosylase